MQLNFEEQDVRVSSLSLNREKHGDENAIGIHINVNLEASPAILDQLIAGDPVFEQLLYDGEGNRRAQGLHGFSFDSEFENHIIKLNHSLDDNFAKEFNDAKLYKFKATPKTGHIIELGLQILLHPSKEQIHWLTDGYEKDIWTLESQGSAQSDLIDDMNGNDEAEAEEKEMEDNLKAM